MISFFKDKEMNILGNLMPEQCKKNMQRIRSAHISAGYYKLYVRKRYYIVINLQHCVNKERRQHGKRTNYLGTIHYKQ